MSKLVYKHFSEYLDLILDSVTRRHLEEPRLHESLFIVHNSYRYVSEHDDFKMLMNTGEEVWKHPLYSIQSSGETSTQSSAVLVCWAVFTLASFSSNLQ